MRSDSVVPSPRGSKASGQAAAGSDSANGAATGIASGVGATLEADGAAELFGEDPHRFVAVVEPGWDPPALGRRIGVIGGASLTIGGESAPVSALDSAWRAALATALNQ